MQATCSLAGGHAVQRRHNLVVTCGAPPPLSAAAASRRTILSAAAAALVAAAHSASTAAPIPPAPEIGGCFECLGEVNETLNACDLGSSSCISTLSDDEQHFAAPWQFDGDRSAAIDMLLAVASGGAFDPGLIDTFGGIRQTDAAVYIAKGVAAVVTGGSMPAQPQRQRKLASDFVPFDGKLVERHTTSSGAEYVRITLGTAGGTAEEVDDPSSVIDAEFLFLEGDNIVNVRAASRVEPEGNLGSGGRLAISFREGLVVDKNVALRQMERLRAALNWELTPVIADFSPAFNSEAPVFFEKLFDPFNRRNDFEPSGVAYPVEGGK